jgi:hypothetical protein
MTNFLEKILNILNNNKLSKFLIKISPFPNDKTLHMFYGFVIFLLFLSITNIYIAYIGIVIIATLKEVYDYFNKEHHTPDLQDIFYTISLPSFYVLSIIIYIII